MRVVSLVPSITETLFDFNLTPSEIVGRTKFCIHPENLVGSIPVIGGTKNIKIDEIIKLSPDFIIANKEENEKNQVEELMKSCPVWVTDIVSIDDNSAFLKELGYRLNRELISERLIDKTETVFKTLKPQYKIPTAYLIWKNPWMTVGGDTFINTILTQLGFENVFSESQRYPIITEDDLKPAELILLSTEPFPFKERHAAELQKKFPNKLIKLVHGEAFSWFGSRPSKSGSYYRSLFKEFQKL